MKEINNLMDLVEVFGPSSQEVLDFISNKVNQRKFEDYFGSKEEEDKIIENPFAQDKYPNEKTQIGIALSDGKIITKKGWSVGKFSKDDVIGIAVITPLVQFILGLDQWEKRWSKNTDECITFEHTEVEAIQILNGFEATKVLVNAQEDEENTVAKLCWNYNYKKHQWYCPSLFELSVVCSNKEEINELLQLVGGTALCFDKTYWSSIEASKYGAWYVIFHMNCIDGTGKNLKCLVRPVTAI